MAKVNVTMDDKRQMFDDCLVMYNNKPIRIGKFIGAKEVMAFDLTSQRNVQLKDVNYEDLKAPGRNLGFVNIGGYAIYVYRNPVRRYKVGLAQENVGYDVPQRYEGILGSARIAALYNHSAPELCDTIFNRFPSISDAYKRCKEGGEKIVAFDRQFAIDGMGSVFYKRNNVGSIPKAVKSNDDIVWKAGFEHLISLLDNNYEKSI